ncbi:MAG: error-prone DNA polymerase [Deltaproteobacteria bacterium]|nr:error-prone DNA polymerase [Deltaproteobacteria bacterium]
MLPYAELHCLSNFTFLRGASHPEELLERADALGYAALALTDECSLAGVVRAHVAARGRTVKLLLGSELGLEGGPRLVLLAADREGYGNLSERITRGRRSAPKGSYRLTRDDLLSLRSSPSGPHALPGCLALLLPGAVPDVEEARWVAETFGDRAWLAVELHCGPDDRARLADLRELGRAVGLPLVAAGDVHMHVRGRRALQDILTAIRLGLPVAEAGYALYPNGERHLRARQRLARLYPEDLLAETLRVAERCSFSLTELRYEYPEEVVPPGETPAAYLRRLTEEGMGRRWPEGAPGKVLGQVEHELSLIAELGYERYFLTVHDIVRFARSRGILCQGRGSAANSAVCFCLGITEVDPARLETLFERFLSRERNEPPDIDIDFEHQRREEVLQYVYRTYGRDRAALAATVITYRRKSAVRDVGKALGLDPEQVDRIAKQFTWWDGGGVSPERLREAGFDPAHPVLARLKVLADALSGFPRHLSQHVGGMVIARGLLCRLVPVENAAMAERTVIQWDKDDLDALGLLKVDCLALGMLTALRRALTLAGEVRGSPLTLADVPAEDPETYAMIRRADTVGVFQIESRAQMAMLPRLKPRTFYDLVVEVAIVRPGPIQGHMVHPYLRRRQGLEPVTYPGPEVRDVLERTLGVPIFQEQVMKLAVVAAGFTPGEADQLRRAMAAWRRKGGLGPFEERLVGGMRERGYPEAFARQVYQQICGFGEYGFPESHAASFALLAYASAWLKCHEPAAFACALLNSQPMGFYAPSQLVQDARRHGVEVRPVDVRRSGWECTLERTEGETGGDAPEQSGTRLRRESSGSRGRGVPFDDAGGHPPGQGSSRAAQWASPSGSFQPALRLGLCLVKGLSAAGGGRLVAARAAGAFRTVEDLAERAGLSRHDLECLVAAGALKGLAGHRRAALWQARGVDPAPLPLLRGVELPEAPPRLPAPSEGEDLVADYASLGLTLGRHPMALLRERLGDLRFLKAAELSRLPHGRRARAAGLVTNRQHPATASGVTFVTLEDETGTVNVVVWRDLAARQRRELLGASLLGVSGVLEREGDVIHLVARRLEDRSALLGDLVARSRDFR